jgi:hypothetical protein
MILKKLAEFGGLEINLKAYGKAIRLENLNSLTYLNKLINLAKMLL